MSRRRLVDVAVACALGATAVLEALANASLSGRVAPTLAATLLLVALTAVRRWHPRPAALGAGAVLPAQALVDGRAHNEVFSAVVAVLLLTFAVSAGCELRRALAGGGALLAGLLVAIAVEGNVFDGLLAAIVLGASWAGGRVAHRLHQQAQELAHLAATLESAREHSVREAALAERARIARDLHDVVAHHVSVMVVQAGGARGALTSDPAAAASALRSVEETGRSALVEMRRLLGVLRDDEANRAPQPRLEDALALLQPQDQLDVTGEQHAVDDGLDVTAYRLLQEALTNARRHGSSPVRVGVHWRSDALELVVENAGGGPERDGGHGLRGMRERVRLFDGSFQAGRTPDGWRVRVVLPLVPAAGQVQV